MLIKDRKPWDVGSSEITPKAVYKSRRRFIGTAAGVLAAPFLGFAAKAATKLEGVVKGPFATDEKQTDYDDVTRYNNFYEFGSAKEDPAVNSKGFKSKPWSIVVDGEVGKPGAYWYEDLIKPHQLEERIYRLRCVEAWSMVIPWVGIPLGDIIKRFEPTSKAKFVSFETLVDPERMIGQQSPLMKWPYREGLRLDEAMNPLAILAVGLFGEELPAQNGAPIRLVVPWKYGFKSIKSIVKIRLTETMPEASWNMAQPSEYGFYANVNPTVDHPRWSQAKERRIGDFLRRKTLMFNGYGEQVASLYAGMDLTKDY
jgi:methionine sulfoxide reductase catalytic subunit